MLVRNKKHLFLYNITVIVIEGGKHHAIDRWVTSIHASMHLQRIRLQETRSIKGRGVD